MGLVKQINQYCSLHPNAFVWFLFTILAILCILFVISMAHVLRGARYNFVVFMNVAIIFSLITYTIFASQQLRNDRYSDVWFFMAICSFTIFHWALAFTYFKCSSEMDYVFNNKKIPPNKCQRYKNIYWALMAISFLSTFWAMLDNKTHETIYFILFATNMGMLLLSSALMIAALVKIRKFLCEKGFKGKMSAVKMVVHAAAYVLYIVSYALSTAIV